MRKVLMLPAPEQAKVDTTNSIHQIVLRLEQTLPAFGWQLTENIQEADLLAGHAGQTYSDTAVDVAHCHGLYPTAQPNLCQPWHFSANQAVVSNLVQARAITTPSEWVADILRRDMHVSPTVISWAIDLGEWYPSENQGYVLWNKTRADGVCDPGPIQDLAKLVSNCTFISTFGNAPSSNLRIIGRQSYEDMWQTIHHAGVYLATTKETFGIGILEAMACGIPILGFRHGNVTELVQHGVHGYLVEPGDIDGLREGLAYCQQYRETLGANAREAARLYTWERTAEQVAGVYNSLFVPKARAKLSVVIPHHNYSQYLGAALQSVVHQETQFSFEIIVVDDGSDPSELDAVRVLAASIQERPVSLQEQSNQGVANARNNGINAAIGEYIVCLDADDQLGHPAFLQTLADALDADRSLGIAFTRLQMTNADDTERKESAWPNGFDWEAQLSGRNQVPTCCMFRKEAWRRAGGFKMQYTPAEDAELWTRIIALGFTARQVVDAPWFLYRWHDGSLSGDIRQGKRPEPDWRYDKPWVTDKRYPFAANCTARPVRNYDQPKVSVIVPVAPYHVPYVAQALDSIERQTERLWECLVINDTGAPLPLVPFPFVKVLDTGGGKGAGYARNLGLRAARAPFVTFLDADDILLPEFLEKCFKAYQRTGRYVYTDWYSLNKDGQVELHETPEFKEGEVFQQPTRHAINILAKREWLKDLTFEEHMPAWEDVDFFMQMARAGICGVRVPEPLLLYRYTTGQLRERGELVKEELIHQFNERYGEYINGGKVCSCNNPPPGKQAKVATNGASNAPAAAQAMTRIIYGGPSGNHEVIGPATRKNYGRRAGGDIFYVYSSDATMAPKLFVPIAEVFEERTRTEVPPPPVPIAEAV